MLASVAGGEGTVGKESGWPGLIEAVKDVLGVFGYVGAVLEEGSGGHDVVGGDFVGTVELDGAFDSGLVAWGQPGGVTMVSERMTVTSAAWSGSAGCGDHVVVDGELAHGGGGGVESSMWG